MSKTIEDFKREYLSVVQTRAMLGDPQNLIGELGRGSGKTTHILGPRFVRVCAAMPQSTVALAGPSYSFVVDTIVPGLLEFLNANYKRGIHFEYGKKPPKHFKDPLFEVVNWKHTISTVWGTVAKFAGVDRANTAGPGQNFAHVFLDELLRISETNFTERLAPAKRGNRQIFGRSHYFGGITGFSSTPNFENDHDWWLNLEENMNKELMEQIIYVAYRVSVALAKVEQWKKEKEQLTGRDSIYLAKKIDRDIDKHLRFAAKWEKKANQKRRGQTLYLKGTSFTNLVVLGLDYMKEQYQGSRHNIDKFKLSILGIRPKVVKDPFFAHFSTRHIFEDSYQYNSIDMHAVDGSYKKSSRDLKHCDAHKPLLVGYDPGGFSSLVFGQERNNELRTIKNIYAYLPDEHHALAQKTNAFFEFHQRRVIYLYYDRAGNQRKDRYRNNPKGDTDAKILKTELENLGWEVHLMNQDQRTIFFWQHYLLFSRLMAEREIRTPRIRICQYECEELISSIHMSPRKKTEDNRIELDKSSERKYDFADQIWYSTQISSAFMYLIYGLYEKWLPQAEDPTLDVPGL